MTRRLASLLAGLTLAAMAPAEPARAATLFESIFGSGGKPAEPAPSPAPQAAPAPATTLPAPAPAPKKPPRPRPSSAETAPVPRAQPAAASVATPIPAPAGPLGERAVIERANAYFNGISTLVGDFTQIGGDGKRVSGKLYLQRPGKLRFEYASPSTLEVIADGASVAVRDRKLVTQDLYAISQTPLKFLLRDPVDLSRDVKVTSVATDPDGVRVMLEDRSTLGGTSRITLFFDNAVETLIRWRIIDPQGYQTNVGLANLEKGRRVDAGLFVISYERVLEDKR